LHNFPTGAFSHKKVFQQEKFSERLKFWGRQLNSPQNSNELTSFRTGVAKWIDLLVTVERSL